ncbi:MAG TPA: regulatory protein RecX [Desulfarculaceae bacterium]|nr:regulatory protein RecX [Desulfarculaceae bacterium]
MSPKAPVTAWWKAQELLARRAHGKQELINKLKLRDFPAPEIDAAIRRLLEKGFLDDEAFARNFTEELFFRRGYGFHAIMVRLRRKGLEAELCENVVKNFLAEVGVEEISAVMINVINRRRSHEHDRERLFAWLKRRGFRSDEIISVLQTLHDRET